MSFTSAFKIVKNEMFNLIMPNVLYILLIKMRTLHVSKNVPILIPIFVFYNVILSFNVLINSCIHLPNPFNAMK